MTATHPLAAAMLAAIGESPDDVSLRRIYADWCEEHGDEERAEFIRLQCRIAESVACEWEDEDGAPCPRYNDRAVANYRLQVWCPTCVKREELKWRERELFDALGANPFAAGFGILCTVGLHNDVPLAPHPQCVVRRGFVEEIRLSLTDWLTHAPAILRATPLRVARLTANGADDLAERDAPRHQRHPFLSEAALMDRALRRLACDDEPGDNPVCRLDTLDLSGVRNMARLQLDTAMDAAYRPWRGLRHLILPNWADLIEQYRPHAVETWKRRVPTLETMTFGGTTATTATTAEPPAAGQR